MKYYNYHKHDHKGNICSLDVVSKLEDYCKRAVELGHDAIFTTNHGTQGDIFEATTLCHQYNLKLIIGSECYYVEDRKEKDKSNRHIIVIALNDDGIRQLNDIISKANIDGFYYKPRIDKELLLSLNPNNFVITTACVAGIWNDEDLIKDLKEHFKNNLYFEVQNHNVPIQKEVNKKILELSKKYNISLIHANDSHYIMPEDYKYRDLFLKAKGIFYENEDKFILDYPDYDEIIKRYEIQGVLNKNQIKEALNSTLVFQNVDCSNYINEDIKLPSVSKDANKELKKIINESWKKEKENVPIEKHDKYLKEIRYEMDIIEKTNMEDYFILDYKIVNKAINEYNGVLTKTGRGSAPSFYITKLLGLTDIDRISSPITLFPTRFMSIERILNAKSIPDIDLNLANPEPFIRASKDLLGDKNCEWMISWKPLQESSGFRLYCKAIGLDINEYNEVAKDLDKYKKDDKWKDIIKDSKPFIGVIEGISESPCSILLYDKDISKEIGLVKTPNDKICCLLDGYNCDKYKYLKNDYLTTQVWAIIKDVCDLVNIPIPSISELDKLLDDKTYEIYTKGLTCTINQADSDYATPLVRKYAPKSPQEMSAFVAIIRPGCASLLNDFLDRKPYTTGVKELDEQLIDGAHRMIYQELIMKYLIWLGVTESHSYDIIKKIAKKKFKEQELKELKDSLLEGWLKQVNSKDGFEETWKVVEDAAAYSFNASHSLSYAYDSLYGAYLKSHYPLEYYNIVLEYYKNDEDRTKKLTEELKEFKIEFKRPKFRYSKSEYFMDKKNNTIYKGTESIKYMNKSVGDYLYSLKDKEYKNFVSLLEDLVNSKIANSRQIEILIKLQFFEEFGNNKKLLYVFKRFNDLYGRKTISKDNLSKLELSEQIIEGNYEKETPKQYCGINYLNILNSIEKNTLDESLPIDEQIRYEMEILGYINAQYNELDKRICYVLEVDTKFSPKVKIYSLGSGKEIDVKINKTTYKDKPIKKGDFIFAEKFEERNKSIKTETGFQKTDQKEWWLTCFEIKKINV